MLVNNGNEQHPLSEMRNNESPTRLGTSKQIKTISGAHGKSRCSLPSVNPILMTSHNAPPVLQKYLHQIL